MAFSEDVFLPVAQPSGQTCLLPYDVYAERPSTAATGSEALAFLLQEQERVQEPGHSVPVESSAVRAISPQHAIWVTVSPSSTLPVVRTFFCLPPVCSWMPEVGILPKAPLSSIEVVEQLQGLAGSQLNLQPWNPIPTTLVQVTFFLQ